MPVVPKARTEEAKPEIEAPYLMMAAAIMADQELTFQDRVQPKKAK